MRRLALLPLLLLLAACASSDSFGIADTRTVDDCQHGEVEVRVGLTGAGTGTGMERNEDRLTFNVEVANNSREDIVVKAIRVEPLPEHDAAYRLDNSYRTFNETVPENEDHVFELPMTGRVVPRRQGQMSGGSETLGLSVTVVLGNGDSYRCQFGVPSPAY